ECSSLFASFACRCSLGIMLSIIYLRSNNEEHLPRYRSPVEALVEQDLSGILASHLNTSCLLWSCFPLGTAFTSQARISGAHNGLCPISDLELAEDIGDMVLHRLGTQHQLPGNRSIALALGDQVEDLALTLSEVREGHGRCRRWERSEVMNQALRNR